MTWSNLMHSIFLYECMMCANACKWENRNCKIIIIFKSTLALILENNRHTSPAESLYVKFPSLAHTHTLLKWKIDFLKAGCALCFAFPREKEHAYACISNTHSHRHTNRKPATGVCFDENVIMLIQHTKLREENTVFAAFGVCWSNREFWFISESDMHQG